MHTPTEYEVETFTGRFVDVSKPDPAAICLLDISHALSQTCRYGGHCKRFYSVAEHAVFVSKRLERKGYAKRVQLAGLHHDDAEAYLGDIPRPIKPLLGYGYEAMTDLMDRAIVEGLGLPLTTDDFHDESVKDADNWSLFVEARHLLPSEGRGWLSGEQGSDSWGLGGQPSRIVTPDYFHGGIASDKASAEYVTRHNDLLRKD